MGKFTVVKTEDPSPYRDQILEFWDEYLTETPPGRFEWMLEGNPAGPATWFIAFEEGKERFAGTISLLPRELELDGGRVRAGIMGDFMIDRQYRVFGPNLQLMREVIGGSGALGFDMIYTIPNAASILVAERVGLKKLGDLRCFIKPVGTSYYLERGAPAALARLVAPLSDAALRIASKESYVSSKGASESTGGFGDSFDTLWNEISGRRSGITGVRSTTYLDWRFSRNPLYNFRTVTTGMDKEGGMGGFIVFCEVESRKLEIYDALSASRKETDRLMAKLLEIARSEDYATIYFWIPEWSGWCRTAKEFGFIKTKSSLALYYHLNREISPRNWDFFSGDRNI